MSNSVKNLIFISIDNLRADCVDKNSLSKVFTPNLDRFVRGGIFFDNCIASAPYTTNAHASMLTGLWPYHHGLIDFFGSKLEQPTLFQLLQKEGYKFLWQTDFSFLLGETLGFGVGADKFVAGDEKQSLEWLTENRESKIAAFFHFANVHEPYGFVDLNHSGADYENKVKALLAKYQIEAENVAWPGKHYPLCHDFAPADMILKQNYRQVIEYLYQKKDYEAIFDLYIEGLNYFDENRFRLFIQSLEKEGFLENALVIITGDHGEHWDENNFGHNKGNGEDALCSEMVQVPLIIWYNNLLTPKRLTRQIRSVDIVPTCWSLLGLSKIKFDGQDLSDFNEAENDLPAFSQWWIVDSALMTIFMNKAKTDPAISPDFNSRLAAASLRQDGFSLFDVYRADASSSSRFLHGNQNVKLSIEEVAILDVFRRRLDEYNRKTEKKYLEKRHEIQEKDKTDIAEQLRAIGYNV